MKGTIVAGILLLLAGSVHAAELTPEGTVQAYLGALQAGKFELVYPLVSNGMKRGKDQEQWVREQRLIMQIAEVKIFGFQVFPGKSTGGRAYVPNLLSSQDKFLNQLGVEEHELYTLIREDGGWKIDQQQIIERSDLGEWFPSERNKTQGDTAP